MVTGLTVNVQVAPGSVTVKERPPIISVAVLDAVEVLGAAVKATEPEPVPLAPPAIVTHDALLVADHAQPVGAVTATAPPPPDAGSAAPAGAIEYEHGTPPCVTVKEFPAMVIVPVRAAPLLAATLYATLPVPLPLAPAVTASQLTLAAADQAQPAGAVTDKVLLLAVEGTHAEFGAIDGVHTAPAWVTVKVAPATLSVPERLPAPVFAATL